MKVLYEDIVLKTTQKCALVSKEIFINCATLKHKLPYYYT